MYLYHMSSKMVYGEIGVFCTSVFCVGVCEDADSSHLGSRNLHLHLLLHLLLLLLSFQDLPVEDTGRQGPGHGGGEAKGGDGGGDGHRRLAVGGGDASRLGRRGIGEAARGGRRRLVEGAEQKVELVAEEGGEEDHDDGGEREGDHYVDHDLGQVLQLGRKGCRVGV